MDSNIRLYLFLRKIKMFLCFYTQTLSQSNKNKYEQTLNILNNKFINLFCVKNDNRSYSWNQHINQLLKLYFSTSYDYKMSFPSNNYKIQMYKLLQSKLDSGYFIQTFANKSLIKTHDAIHYLEFQ